MSSCTIVTHPEKHIYEPEQLKNSPIAVRPFNGSYFTMLKMLECFLDGDQIEWVNVGRRTGGRTRSVWRPCSRAMWKQSA
jgi:hypothetical protein